MELLKKISLLVASSLIFLLLMEGGYRIFVAVRNSGSLEDQLKRSQETSAVPSKQGVSLAGLIQPSKWKDVVYELKPNLSVTFQGKEVRTNSLSMRKREVPVEKSPGLRRIAGLGDSIMFGWGVSEPESYLAIIEAELTKSSPTETLNFGVPGYNSAMEVALFEHRGIKFSPDIIVVQFVNNDFDVPAFMLRPEEPGDFSKSLLLQFVTNRLSRSGVAKSATGLLSVQRLGKNKSAEDKKVLKDYEWMTGEKGVTTAFTKLRALQPATRIIILTGSKTGVQQKLLRRLAKSLNFELVEVGPFVDRYLKANNIPNDKETRKKLLTVSANDRHPNALGHQIIADALLSVLR